MRTKLERTMWVIGSAIAACVLCLLGLLLYWSWPGHPRPYKDGQGNPLPRSLNIKHYQVINGAMQGMFITSKDTANPVLLLLHGGLPVYFLSKKYPTGLADHFTVVWWDRRGSGLSFDPAEPPAVIGSEQLVKDAIEVTNYLRERFGQEKIYVMGHSGGTFLGIKTVVAAPELFHAYVGVAQMADQLTSEILAYEHMLEQYRIQGNSAMVRKLEGSPVTRADGPSRSYLQVRDEAMHALGIGTTRDMRSVFSGLMLPSFQCRDYTLKEKINLWRGKIASGVSAMWPEMIATDLREQVNKVEVPIYFFHGIHDHTCSYPLAKDLYGRIQAPVKGFYTFHHSAHTPIFEEPERAREILLKDVLTGGTSLADDSPQH